MSPLWDMAVEGGVEALPTSVCVRVCAVGRAWGRVRMLDVTEEGECTGSKGRLSVGVEERKRIKVRARGRG